MSAGGRTVQVELRKRRQRVKGQAESEKEGGEGFKKGVKPKAPTHARRE